MLEAFYILALLSPQNDCQLTPCCTPCSGPLQALYRHRRGLILVYFSTYLLVYMSTGLFLSLLTCLIVVTQWITSLSDKSRQIYLEVLGQTNTSCQSLRPLLVGAVSRHFLSHGSWPKPNWQKNLSDVCWSGSCHLPSAVMWLLPPVPVTWLLSPDPASMWSHPPTTTPLSTHDFPLSQSCLAHL